LHENPFGKGRQAGNIIRRNKTFLQLVGASATRLKNTYAQWSFIIQNMVKQKTCLKPPTRPSVVIEYI
jgi:hypothetical protein